MLYFLLRVFYLNLIFKSTIHLKLILVWGKGLNSFFAYEFLISQFYFIEFYDYSLSVLLFMHYYHSVVGFKIWECLFSNFILLFKNILVFWLLFISIQIFGSNCQFLQRISKKTKKPAGIVIEFVLNLWINWGNITILTTLNISIYEHGISLYLFWPLIF